ncbi:LppU/SCO3897 family protein [Microbispora bryophytorum]|uniref:Uncharacterized protein n=1 Tax=Microbispora bryophytorum TaxID=1460882 RepID=A0A8H9H1W2_9ACTN|nr:hypothetical protein [Microbispora bryophytorum]MBD3137680.1 hypothetical protein [Microbispora bryophytorum]TQS05961.1 hypothetical protein FLX07_16495 [Microbispora bryophytorum]GGO20350.1 hypothetical protein GCM10011574_46740 [Microbispora bryophytorum]
MTETPQQPSTYGQKATGVGMAVGKRIVAYAVGAAVLAGGGFVYKQVTGAPEIAKAGDCMAGATADELKVVSCADPAAALTVEGRIDGKTQQEWDADNDGQICSAYAKADQTFWEGEEGKAGYVLCLAPKN